MSKKSGSARLSSKKSNAIRERMLADVRDLVDWGRGDIEVFRYLIATIDYEIDADLDAFGVAMKTLAENVSRQTLACMAREAKEYRKVREEMAKHDGAIAALEAFGMSKDDAERVLREHEFKQEQAQKRTDEAYKKVIAFTGELEHELKREEVQVAAGGAS